MCGLYRPEQAAGTSLWHRWCSTLCFRMTNIPLWLGERGGRGGSDESILNHSSFTSWRLVIDDVRWSISVHRDTLWTRPFNRTPAVRLFFPPLHLLVIRLSLSQSFYLLSTRVSPFSVTFLRSVTGDKSRGEPPLPEASSHLVPADRSDRSNTFLF